MPARTGQQYLTGLCDQKREVGFRGDHMKEVTTEPGLARDARAIAALYDVQTNPTFRVEMPFSSPKTVAPPAMQIPARASRPEMILLDACQGARGMRLVIDQVIRTMQPAGQAYFEDVSPIGLFGERQNPRFYLPGRHDDPGRPF
jgi:4-hydroxyphenylacetate 3-hydroxylase N terminal